jgi:pimeloyl-ACP methyl ester carboxylesterase
MDHRSVFIHGLLGSSSGYKATFFRERYPDMIMGDFRGDLGQRMEKLNGLLAGEDSLILIGSSYGGLMAAIYALGNPDRVKKAILLSPALAHDEIDPYLEQSTDLPVIIYHGEKDDVVPLGPVHENARRIFKNLTFNAVDDDHVLSATFTSIDWDGLLKA